jgi:hypothetical protein
VRLQAPSRPTFNRLLEVALSGNVGTHAESQFGAAPLSQRPLGEVQVGANLALSAGLSPLSTGSLYVGFPHDSFT